jgi:hypothetical protein
MKTLPRFFLLLLLGLTLGRAVTAEQVVERIPLTPDQIEELVAPIALYPDPLVALILPASTFPSDIVLAARYLERGGVPDKVGNEPWDESVQSLARYREVVDYLDDHLDWTRRLGYCFLDQRDAVMDAIQEVRVRARTAGLLGDTPQQQVIVETEEIRIVPAEPTVIYVPRYDPVVLYRPAYSYSHYRGSFISFGIGWSIGSWLNYDCDWRSHGIRVVHRPAHWYHRPDWHIRNRYAHHTSTHWTRRTHSRHDDRFDRSPRRSGHGARGSDHRHGTSPHRYDGHSRDGGDRNHFDGRRDGDRRDGNRYVGHSPQQNRSRPGDERRRSEPNSPRPQVDPISRIVPVVPPTSPIAGPTVHSTPRTYRPHSSTPLAGERRNYPDRSRHQASNPPSVRHDRPQSGSPGVRATASRPPPRVEQPRIEQPRTEQPAARRAEAAPRSDDNRRGNNSHKSERYQNGLLR